jgi:hypothetical protein
MEGFKGGGEMRKIFLLILILLALPLISAGAYGTGPYSAGLYGIGKVEVAPSVGGGGRGLQFDIKILDFESPIGLGETFEFMYFIKGVGAINNDVTIDFWVEKDGEIITSGSDVIFMGVDDEKTEAASLFMPSDVVSGVYKFVIRVSYGSVKAEAHRTIELEVKDGEAIIESLFDIRFYLEDILLESSDDIRAVVVFENFGARETSVNLIFTILNGEGEIVYEEDDDVGVQTVEILTKSFKGLNLDNGGYTIILKTVYGDNIEDEFSQDFEIRKDVEVSEGVGIFKIALDWIMGKIRWIISGIIALLVALLIWFIVVIVKRREGKECDKKVARARRPAKKKVARARKPVKKKAGRVKKRAIKRIKRRVKRTKRKGKRAKDLPRNMGMVELKDELTKIKESK